MAKAKKLSNVVLVGRMNVGKSAFFNRLTGTDTSIVFDQKGVTRDYVEGTVSWQNETFNLIDTGGLTTKKLKTDLDKLVQAQIEEKLKEASAILFVCDITTGPLEEDLFIARQLRAFKKKTALLINKADSPERDINAPEFICLGFDKIIPISALHGRGMRQVLEWTWQQLPMQPEIIEESKIPYHTVIVGKPNVGKSSLLNKLLREDRAIVSPIAGTTREAISKKLLINQNAIMLTDTAGVRRRRSVTEPLEKMMVKTSMSAIRDANIVMLMIDASAGELSSQELKILSYAHEQNKALLIIFNKIDLLDEFTEFTLKRDLEEYDFLFSRVPQLWMSCMTGKNVFKVMKALESLEARCNQDFKPDEVNEYIQAALKKNPIYRHGKLMKVFKARSVKADIPTFHVYLQNPQIFSDSDKRYIENLLRSKYDLLGCPIRISTAKI